MMRVYQGLPNKRNNRCVWILPVSTDCDVGVKGCVELIGWSQVLKVLYSVHKEEPELPRWLRL